MVKLMANQIVNVNGEIIAPDEAKVSVFDRSFLYGDSLYEVARTYDGKFFGDEGTPRSAAEIRRALPYGPGSASGNRTRAKWSARSKHFKPARHSKTPKPTAASSSAAERGKIGFGLECLETPTQYVIIVQPLDPLDRSEIQQGPQAQDRRAHPQRRARAGSRGENRKLSQLASGLSRSPQAKTSKTRCFATPTDTSPKARLSRSPTSRTGSSSPRRLTSEFSTASRASTCSRSPASIGMETREVRFPRERRLRSRRSHHDQHDLRILSRHPSRRSQDRKRKTRPLRPQTLGGLSEIRARSVAAKSSSGMTKEKSPLRQLENAAVSAALAAGSVLRKHFGKPISIREKDNLSLVTNADVEAEETCIKLLLKKFPDFGVLAEESDPRRLARSGTLDHRPARRHDEFRSSLSDVLRFHRGRVGRKNRRRRDLSSDSSRNDRRRSRTRRSAATENAFTFPRPESSTKRFSRRASPTRRKPSSSRDGSLRATQRDRPRRSGAPAARLSTWPTPGVEFLTVSGSATFPPGTWPRDPLLLKKPEVK